MENPQLEIGYGNPVQADGIYVNSLSPKLYPELRWKEGSLNEDVPRRTMRLPIYIKALTEWRSGPVETVKFFGFPAFPDLFSLTLSDSDGKILRSATITPVFLTLLNNGEINLPAGDTAFVWIRMALFDLASLANQDVYATLVLDPTGKFPGVSAIQFAYFRIGVHSAENIGAVR